MAAGSTVKSLWEEGTCPFCLEYFTAPVVLECGHNFCWACLSGCWKGPGLGASCLQCSKTVQQRPLQPNKQLAEVVEIAQQLGVAAVQKTGGNEVCGEHQEALKLFCEEDQTPICVICRESQAHRSHIVFLIEEAAQEYKGKIQAHLKMLREEREKLLGWKMAREGRTLDYLKQTRVVRQKIVAQFQQLRQFLEEQERHLLAQLQKLDEENLRLQKDSVRKYSAQISHLSELIGELEEKCQNPATEFLQDVKSTLGRCGKGRFQQPEKISPELEKKLSDFSQKTVALKETLRKFKDTLPSALERARGKSLGAFRQATVTLDPDTAHPQLVLSEDQKCVRWAATWQPLRSNPERFDTELCVLGCERLMVGKHCWEVEVQGGERWAVGVARESVRRKGHLSRSPEGEIWAVKRLWGQFWALTSPATRLSLPCVPKRIRVCLDWDQGQVTFIDAANEAPIFTFPPGSLPRERIRPWLWLGWESWLSLHP